MRHHTRLAIALTMGLLFAGTGSATPIIIQADAGLAANAAALGAFNRAATRWGSLLSDPITVTIKAGFVNMGNSNVLGSASAVFLQGDYSLIRNQMVADAVGEANNAVVAALPTAAQFSAFMPAGFGLSGNMTGTKANLKAMGFGGLDTLFGASDANVTFNSAFTFDFDNSNGVAAGAIDFETVAMHEIGHVLGFVSTVDTVDFLRSVGRTGAMDIMPLDLFRFGAADPSTLANFSTTARDLRSGVPAYFDDLTNQWSFSTGDATGDGRQASHWKDDDLTGIHIGAMDPTLDFAASFPIDYADLRALDLIGWDLLEINSVPEPGALPLALLALGMAGFAARRRQNAVRPARPA